MLITAVGIVNTDDDGKEVGTEVAGIITKVVDVMVIIVTDLGTEDDFTKTGDDGNVVFVGITIVSRTLVAIAGGIAVVGTVKTDVVGSDVTDFLETITNVVVAIVTTVLSVFGTLVE